MLVIANARHFGGAFRIAPTASVTDGLLDAIAIEDAPTLRRLQLFAAVIRGTHAAMPEVQMEQSRTFTLQFPEAPAYETDGEYRRAASAALEVSCVPNALRVVVPTSALVP
jgi:diacylglycerol kinase (ATP)